MEDRRIDSGEIVEIELTGVSANPAADTHGDPALRPRQPLLLALAAAGTAVLIVVAVVLLGDDGGETASDTRAPTTPVITSPQTLRSFDTIAPFDTNAPDAPGPPPAALLAPSHPPAADRDNARDSFDLTTAVEKLTVDRPRRTVTDYLGGSGGVSRFAIETQRDTSNDRFVLVTRRGDVAHSIVVDLAGGTTYQSINSQTTSWFRLSNDDMEAGLAGGIREVILDPFVTGPLDSAWIETQAIRPGGWVTLPSNGTEAREFVLTVESNIAADRLRNRAAPNAPPDTPVELHLYVTEASELVLIEGTFHDGEEWTLVTHRLEPLTSEDAVVELPDPELVSGASTSETVD